MNANIFDVIVIGLGAMGSAATYALSRRGIRVLGLDRFTPPHTKGSAAGETRMIREAYAGASQYVRMVQWAFEAWRDIARRSGRRIIVESGALVIGPPDGVLVSGAIDSARRYDLPFELLTPAAVRARFPLQPSEDMIGLVEPRAGILYADQCIETLLELASGLGAALRGEEPAIEWEARGAAVTVRTSRDQYEAAALILAAGPWMPGLLGSLRVPLEIERQVVHWVEPRNHPERFVNGPLPTYIMEYGTGNRWYGFPQGPRGIKVALHHQGRVTEPNAVDPPTADDRRNILNVLERYMPDAAGRVLESGTCMYTNTPDEDFVIDLHPAHRRVVIASPCSGHGFKFSIVIGEILADLALEGRTEWDLSPFRLDRFRDAR